MDSAITALADSVTYDEFEDTARELFGLRREETGDFADLMDDAGWPLEEFDADDTDFWEVGSDLIDEFLPEEFELDPYFPDDEYLDPGDIWELTAEGYAEV